MGMWHSRPFVQEEPIISHMVTFSWICSKTRRKWRHDIILRCWLWGLLWWRQNERSICVDITCWGWSIKYNRGMELQPNCIFAPSIRPVRWTICVYVEYEITMITFVHENFLALVWRYYISWHHWVAAPPCIVDCHKKSEAASQWERVVYSYIIQRTIEVVRKCQGRVSKLSKTNHNNSQYSLHVCQSIKNNYKLIYVYKNNAEERFLTNNKVTRCFWLSMWH